MKRETFIARVMGENRISIPQVLVETMNIKKGQKVRIIIAKISMTKKES
jgi:bifunctional DNA-binding transcriptional regulator/antitoxin component of YhaV-PrlF toxin-antitoxin module